MSESSIALWINTETNSLLPNWNTFGSSSLPSIKQGDQVEFEIHWVKSDLSGQFMEEVVLPSTSVIKVAVGVADAVPTSGSFIYSFGGDTVEIPYDATATAASTLINSLASIISAGGVSVLLVNQRTFRITFNNFGSRSSSACDATGLRPSANIYVSIINVGSGSSKAVHHLRPKILPVAYSDAFTNTPAPSITITSINSITNRIKISPSPKVGTFSISNGTKTTGALSVNASASTVLNALVSATISNSTRTYSVAKSGDYSWDIYRTLGTSETLSITTSGIIGFSSKTGVVDFNTFEVEDLLAGNSSVSAMLEVEYSYAGSRHTIYQGAVTIVNDLIEVANYSPSPFPAFTMTEAPIDSEQYVRKNSNWSILSIDGGTY
jgi:hypothetical protein